MKKALTSYFDLGSPLTPDRMLDWVEFATDQEEKEAILKVCPRLYLVILTINLLLRFTGNFYSYSTDEIYGYKFQPSFLCRSRFFLALKTLVFLNSKKFLL